MDFLNKIDILKIMPNSMAPKYKFNDLSNNTILNISNEINGLLVDKDFQHKDLMLPQIVVVGAQSSGKTSILNNIISLDILPTGEEMVTRVPLELQLIKITDTRKNVVELWDKELGIMVQSINISVPIKANESNEIKTMITNQTTKIAGTSKNVSSKPIILKVLSNNDTNLSLIDLPGLVMIARSDKGQPKDIKEQIEKMVVNYVKRPKTIVLVIMQARTDLETDIGLHLIKHNMISDTKVLGVLTKPDLMNQTVHIGEYLLNNMSHDLKLNNGYFVVKCRNDTQRKTITMQEGYDLERTYFSNHYEYNKSIYSATIGTLNLVHFLTKLLITDIKSNLMSSLVQLDELERKVSIQLKELGEKVPDTSQGKLVILNTYVSEFCHTLINNLIDGTAIFNAPVEIKNIFLRFKSNIIKVRPYDDSALYTDEYFRKLRSELEGNHMVSYASNIKIVEHCIQSETNNPVLKLTEICLQTVEHVIECIKKLISSILELQQFSKYNQMVKFIYDKFCTQYLPQLQSDTNTKIKEVLQCYKYYVWTDNPTFCNMLNSEKNIKKLLSAYFDTIVFMVQDMVPKYIMYNIVHHIQHNVNSYVYNEVIKNNKIEYIYENTEVQNKRNKYYNILQSIARVKTQLNSVE